MPGLHDLLEDAAGDRLDLDVAADLRRGRRALSRRRTRVVAGVTGGLVVAGGAAYTTLAQHRDSVTVARPADRGPSAVPTPFYDVPEPPAGWHVVGERAQYVMLTRDGSGVTSVDASFIGQIVIGLTDGSEHFETQPSVEYDGRTFYVNLTGGDAADGNMATLSVRSLHGDWLQVQYPQADFGVHDMIAYLDGVEVQPGALPALG